MTRYDLTSKVVQAIAWLGKHRRISTDGVPVKVNLGSGLCVVEGWIHVDGSLNALFARLPAGLLGQLYRFSDCRQWYAKDEYLRILSAHRFVHHRLEYGVPCDDGTVDYIYSSHALEHLYKEDATFLVRDAYRALKVGGRIRIGVPSLEYAVQRYHLGAKEEAMTYFFSLNHAGAVRQHHYMYDFDLLRALLASAGFADIERRAYQQGLVPDLELLDNRPEETLFVEARK